MARGESRSVDVVSAEDTVIDRGSERLSSFKVTRNATGKVQIEVKRYAERNDQEAVNEAVADAKRMTALVEENTRISSLCGRLIAERNRARETAAHLEQVAAERERLLWLAIEADDALKHAIVGREIARHLRATASLPWQTVPSC